MAAPGRRIAFAIITHAKNRRRIARRRFDKRLSIAQSGERRRFAQEPAAQSLALAAVRGNILRRR
jgi:hypothetical protein